MPRRANGDLLQDAGAHFPFGGRIAPNPFAITSTVADDFLGTKASKVGSLGESLVKCELASIRPGSGDDVIRPHAEEVYPTAILLNARQDKGAGGDGAADGSFYSCPEGLSLWPHGNYSSPRGTWRWWQKTC
jgi:hypothetical protein